VSLNGFFQAGAVQTMELGGSELPWDLVGGVGGAELERPILTLEDSQWYGEMAEQKCESPEDYTNGARIQTRACNPCNANSEEPESSFEADSMSKVERAHVSTPAKSANKDLVLRPSGELTWRSCRLKASKIEPNVMYNKIS
jgi:hypothetical protein